MAAIAHDGGGQPRLLLRRLMVMCPVTGLAVDTGYELTSIPALGRGPALLVDCVECGQDHYWLVDDAFLEP